MPTRVAGSRAGTFQLSRDRGTRQVLERGRAAIQSGRGRDGRQERYLLSAEGVRLFRESVEVSGEFNRLAADGGVAIGGGFEADSGGGCTSESRASTRSTVAGVYCSTARCVPQMSVCEIFWQQRRRGERGKNDNAPAQADTTYLTGECAKAGASGT